VTFGTEENFRTEYLSFEVADFRSSYHAILGRPMLAKFMAIPHYTYLVLKICKIPAIYSEVRFSATQDKNGAKTFKQILYLTDARGVKLHSGLPGPTLLLSQLVFDLLLVCRRRLVDLLKLLLKLDHSKLRGLAFLSRSAMPFARSSSDCSKITDH
jgi:hypothetical protein